jgi:hypothetical protein
MHKLINPYKKMHARELFDKPCIRVYKYVYKYKIVAAHVLTCPVTNMHHLEAAAHHYTSRIQNLMESTD